jgi:homoserine O-acetyltransferase
MGLETFTTANFALQKGGSFPEVTLAYSTLGTLSPKRDNVVVLPTWYSGDHVSCEAALTGPDRALDPGKYFIIIPNLLGGGVSSSPSNAVASHKAGRFPQVTLYDNVRLQHMMLQSLEIEHLKLVAGWSMGGCQAFQWATQYPTMMDAVVPMCCSARTASFNQVFLVALRRAIETDPTFAKGFYTVPPIAGLKTFAAIYAGWGFSEPFYRTEGYRVFGAKSAEQFVEYFWEPALIHHDANNLLALLWTWMNGDVSDTPAYGGDFAKALGSIKAKTIILPGQTDSYFPPVDSRHEASLIPNGTCREVPSIWGHMCVWNPDDRGHFDAALSEALAIA